MVQHDDHDRTVSHIEAKIETRMAPYKHIGEAFLDNREQTLKVDKLTQRLQAFGCRVSLEPLPDSTLIA